MFYIKQKQYKKGQSIVIIYIKSLIISLNMFISSYKLIIIKSVYFL